MFIFQYLRQKETKIIKKNMLPQNDIYKNNLRVYKKYRATLFPNKRKSTEIRILTFGVLVTS